MLDSRGSSPKPTRLTYSLRTSRPWPRRALSCPEGIKRAVALEICASEGSACSERDLSFAEVYLRDEMFCSGTMGELAPIIEVDGRQIGDGRPGLIFQRLSVSFAECTKTQGTIVVNSVEANTVA